MLTTLGLDSFVKVDLGVLFDQPVLHTNNPGLLVWLVVWRVSHLKHYWLVTSKISARRMSLCHMNHHCKGASKLVGICSFSRGIICMTSIFDCLKKKGRAEVLQQKNRRYLKTITELWASLLGQVGLHAIGHSSSITEHNHGDPRIVKTSRPRCKILVEKNQSDREVSLDRTKTCASHEDYLHCCIPVVFMFFSSSMSICYQMEGLRYRCREYINSFSFCNCGQCHGK